MRSKLEALVQAMTGHFDDHHGFLAQIICQHIDVIDAMIAELDARIDAELVPYRRQVELLDSVAGIDTRGAQVILAEIGVDMHQFPGAAHLASWAGVCPGNNKTGKAGGGRTGRGDPWLKAALGVDALAAIRKRDSCPGRSTDASVPAAAACAPSSPSDTVSCKPSRHILSTGTPYRDLGADYHLNRANRTTADAAPSRNSNASATPSPSNPSHPDRQFSSQIQGAARARRTMRARVAAAGGLRPASRPRRAARM